MAKKTDLMVRVTSRNLIRASDATRTPSIIDPSNLDYVSGNVSTQLFTIYSKPPGLHSFASVVATFRRSLPDFLNYFFPFTGRLLPDDSTGLLKIHCNNAGAELVVAHANIPLTLVPFDDITKSLDKIKIPYAEDIPLSVQVVGFSCGGFSIMWGTNHLMCDGRTMFMIPTLWAEFVRTGKLSTAPIHDRSIFRPRYPPRFSAEVSDSYVERVTENLINVLSASAFVRRLYCIEGEDVERLRLMASKSGRKATKLEAISAYLWKSLAAVIGDADNKCRIMWWVDWRLRLRRPELKYYAGNVVSSVTKEADVADITKASYADVAELVGRVIKEETGDAEEKVQEMVDWMEEWKKSKGSKKSVLKLLLGLGSPTMVISTVHQFGIDMDFGFGQPGHITAHIPSGRFGRGFIVLLPSPKSVGGIVMSAYVWRQLAEKMERDGEPVIRRATPEKLGLVQMPILLNRL